MRDKILRGSLFGQKVTNLLCLRNESYLLTFIMKEPGKCILVSMSTQASRQQWLQSIDRRAWLDCAKRLE